MASIPPTIASAAKRTVHVSCRRWPERLGCSTPLLRERENASRCSTRIPSFRSILIFAFAANAVWAHAIPLQAIIRFILQNVVCGHRLRRLLVPTGKPQGANRAATACKPVRRGALTMKRRAEYREWEVERVLTTCPHCATGCQYNLIVKNGRIVDTEAVDGPLKSWLAVCEGPQR